MSAPTHCQLIGRWRIVSADIRDRDYLNLIDPAIMAIQASGHGDEAPLNAEHVTTSTAC